MPYECGLKDVVIIFLKNLIRKEKQRWKRRRIIQCFL